MSKIKESFNWKSLFINEDPNKQATSKIAEYQNTIPENNDFQR